MPAEVPLFVEPRKLLPIRNKTDLWSMTKTELQEHAKKVGIKVEGEGWRKCCPPLGNKDNIIEALMKYYDQNQVQQDQAEADEGSDQSEADEGSGVGQVGDNGASGGGLPGSSGGGPPGDGSNDSGEEEQEEQQEEGDWQIFVRMIEAGKTITLHVEPDFSNHVQPWLLDTQKKAWIHHEAVDERQAWLNLLIRGFCKLSWRCLWSRRTVSHVAIAIAHGSELSGGRGSTSTHLQAKLQRQKP